MAKSKRKSLTFTTPVGVFKYPHIMEPEFGTKEFPKPDGEYNNHLIFKKDNPAVQALIAKLTPLHQQAVQNGEAKFADLKVDTRKKLKKITVNEFYKELYDEETEEPTGEIEFAFKMKASGVSKKEKEQAAQENRPAKRWNRKPGVFDTSTPPKPLPKGTQVWGGSTGLVTFEVDLNDDGTAGYFIPGTGMCGISLKLAAVQVFTLVQGGERSAESYGFKGSDGGFTVADLAETTDAPETAPAEKADDAEVEVVDDGNF